MTTENTSMAGDDTSSERTTSAISPAMAPRLLAISDKLRDLVDFTGRWASLFILPLIVITVWDVIVRKMGTTQIWLVENFGRPFESTILQELEWHFHTGLFALVLGYGYVHNTHVRVDLVREHLSFRKKAWLEFLGCTFFLIPFCTVVLWFAIDYTYMSFAIGEISASQVGLPYRWMIKSVLVLGLIMVLLAGIAVWLQMVLVLFGPKELRFPLMTVEWPEQAGSGIEGKKRVELEDSDDEHLRAGPKTPT